MTARHCFWAGMACVGVAGCLTALFSNQIFSAQSILAKNEVIVLKIAVPGLKLEVIP